PYRIGVSDELDAGHLLALGRVAEARAAIEEALELYGKSVGKDHPLYGSALEGQGRVLLAEGKAREAVPVFERGLAISERGTGTGSSALLRVLVGLADARLAARDA